jgi:hypothetical protein
MRTVKQTPLVGRSSSDAYMECASVDPNKEQKMTHIQKLEIIPIQRKRKRNQRLSSIWNVLKN